MTWGLGSPRKLISLSKNPFLSVDKESAYKRTLRLLNSITISQDYVERKNRTEYETEDINHWTVIYIFDVALEKKGKSARLKAVCDFFRSVYPEELFWSARSKTQLEDLYDSIPEGKQYIFIGVEDGTAVLKDRKKAEKARSKARRHICKKRTGHQAGVLIQYIGTHRWWDIDPLLRGDTTLVIFGSVTDEMNTFDNIQESKWVSIHGLEFLKEKDKAIQKVETIEGKRKSKQLERELGFWFGMALVRNNTDKGLNVFYLPEIDSATLFDLVLDEEIEHTIKIEHEWIAIDLFDWEEKIYEELLVHPEHNKYAEFWKVLIIEQEPAGNPKTWEKLNCRRTTVFERKKDLLDKNSSVNGFITNKRGEELFEQFVINACEDLGINYQHKPQLKIASRTYEDDLQIREKMIINLKVGEGMNSYNWEDHYKTTYLFSQNGFETCVLYYDLTRNLVQIFDSSYISNKRNLPVGSDRTDNPFMTLSEALKILSNFQKISRLTPFPPADFSPTVLSLESIEREGGKTINQTKGVKKEDV